MGGARKAPQGIWRHTISQEQLSQHLLWQPPIKTRVCPARGTRLRLWQLTSLPTVGLPGIGKAEQHTLVEFGPCPFTSHWVRSAHVDPSACLRWCGVGGFGEPNRKRGGSLGLVPPQILSGLGRPSPALTLQNFHISKVGACVRSLKGAAPPWRNAQGQIPCVGSP